MTWYWQFWQQIMNDASLLRWQEWVSTLTQLASVWYASRNNILVYPTGMVGVILAFWLYLFAASPPLYADAILNLYYFAMSGIGWYNWTRMKDDKEHTFTIRMANTSEKKAGVVVFFTSWLLIGWALSSFTDSNTPVLDALVTSSAITAMWWMAVRLVENWYMWTLSNLVAIPLNFYKGFILFTVMYIIFLFMSMNGVREWKKKIETSTFR